MIVWSWVSPSFTVMLEGWASTGGWLAAASVTVIRKDFESLAVPSDALTEAS